jgi:hypothetical protein
MDERRQFRRLVRDFSCRFLDNEFLSAEGDTSQTAANTLALLLAAGLSLSLFFGYKYVRYMPASFTYAQREAVSWPDKQFLISLAMSVIGVALVIAWDALFPDRRDAMTLSALPIRERTIFGAKVCSVLAVFAVITAALNIVPAVILPALLATGAKTAGLVRYFLAHVAAIAGASVFVFATILAVQGVLINLLSYRLYKWISTWVQMGTLFAVLCMFFLTPQVAYPDLLADPRNRLITHSVPAFWFLGLYQELLGSSLGAVHELAALARGGLVVSIALAVATYSFGYRRYMRKTVEEADTVAGDPSRRASFLLRLLDRILLPKPMERAVFHFGARTMTRNRKHRLLLALYGALGIAYVFKGAAVAFQNPAGRDSLFDIGISSVPLVLSFMVMFGMRMAFPIPVELRSNWIFQLTENGRPAEYLSGVRKLMIAVGIVPLAVATFPLYWFLWGGFYAARHLVLVVLILLVAMEYLVREFPKIPFTCSFLPGKANLKATIGIYVILFVVLASMLTAFELWLVQRPAGYWKGVAAISVVLVYRAWRRNRWERRLSGFVYEEKPGLLASLDLQH